MKTVDLSKYKNNWYSPGSTIKRSLWYLIWLLFFRTAIPYPSRFKCILLRLFGSQIGCNVVIKPRVTIKYPWYLSIGNNTWIGENSWLDNLVEIKIGANVVISQSAYILTGNHDFNSSSFKLILQPVLIEDGAWVGAGSIVCGGAKISTHVFIGAGSVFSGVTKPYGIYSGNPAVYKKLRNIN